MKFQLDEDLDPDERNLNQGKRTLPRMAPMQLCKKCLRSVANTPIRALKLTDWDSSGRVKRGRRSGREMARISARNFAILAVVQYPCRIS